MTTTLITPDFEKALALACVQRATRYTTRWPGQSIIANGDEYAVRYGPFLRDIAEAAGMSVPMTRRRMHALHAEGRVLRYDIAGGCTSWWLVGLAANLMPLPSDPPTVPASSSGMRQTLTQPVAIPARQHWSDVLGVARDCSTSEARDAYRDALARVDDLDLDAEQQRQRIRDAYSQRLSEDGISEYE